ncbi:MAG: hypothetical protein V4658_05770 [Bacteroidota bacterium]
MRSIITLGFLLFFINGFTQGTYIPLGTSTIHMLDRFEIKSGRMANPSEFNTTTKAYQRHRIAAYVDSFDVVGAKLSEQDYFNLGYLQNDNFEFSRSESTKSKRSFLGIYKYKASAYTVKDTDDFTLVMNPVTLLQAGYETNANGNPQPSINIRGVELRGRIGNKLGFYTYLTDEIVVPNSWVRDFYNTKRVIPGAGFLKADPDSNPASINSSRGIGYIVYQPIKQMDIQFGHGTNFLGNGYRTFYMSDFSRELLFLRVNTRIWKINYTNIWGQMFDYVSPSQRNKPKRHYFATTYANVNLSRNFNLGLFQTVSFQRDSGYSNGGYDMQYLNPIIFYKPIENGLNSPDKTILGIDFKWDFLRHFQLYGQAVISEFKIDQMLTNKGWFGNKWAVQTGLKYIDVAGVSNLDLQLEMNIARPYMYTSFNPMNAYVNFNQNMAHPLGANFYEYIGVLRYQPFNRLFLKGTGIFAIYGNDTNGSNFGKDIRLSYENLYPDNIYGHYITQGIRTTLLTADFTASYMIKHNLFFDVQFLYRRTDSELAEFETQTVFINGTVRWNFAEKRWDF